MGQLLTALAVRHEVAALFLQRPDDEPVGVALRSSLALAEAVPAPSLHRGGLEALRRSVRRATALARGRPVWVNDYHSGP